MSIKEPATQWQAAPSNLIICRPPMLEDLDTIAAMEAASYPPDEKASRDRLEYRIKEAPGLFLVATQLDTTDNSTNTTPTTTNDDAPAGYQILGFCCGTTTTSQSLTEESMATHEPDGTLLCIHSVCVNAAHRRQGIASKLLQAYLNYVQQTTPELAEVRLICKEPLVGLYEKAGFEVVGPSDVVHGQDAWIEMKIEFLEEEGGGGQGNGGMYNDWT